MRVTTVKALCLVLLGILVGGGTIAAADSLLTSADIKDGGIQNRDIRVGAITLNRLTDNVQEMIEASSNGAPGAPGTPGAPGAPGAPGGSSPAPTLTSDN